MMHELVECGGKINSRALQSACRRPSILPVNATMHLVQTSPLETRTTWLCPPLSMSPATEIQPKKKKQTPIPMHRNRLLCR